MDNKACEGKLPKFANMWPDLQISDKNVTKTYRDFNSIS